MAFVSVAIGVAGLGLGAATAAGAFTPGQPNLAAASAEQANAEASALPQMDLLEAAAQTGGEYLKQGYTKGGDAASVRANLQSQINTLQNQLSTSTSDQSSGHNGGLGALFTSPNARNIQKQISTLQQQLSAVPQSGQVYYNSQGQIVPQSQASANFTGYGTADIQKQLLAQEAAGQLANAKEFDPQYIAEAAAQEKLANPQGVTARGELYDQIQKQIANPPVSPVADEMNRQVTERANAGSGLTPEELAALNNDVSQMGSITGTSGNTPNFSRELTTGFAGQQRALGNAQAGGAFLASGESPDEIKYRAEQQNLSNLGNFIKGITPEAQFSELSGASTGPTPTAQAAPLPTLDMGAANRGAQGALTGYQQQLNQPNPWLSGVSAALNLGSTINTALG